jgi:hypothetical protein
MCPPCRILFLCEGRTLTGVLKDSSIASVLTAACVRQVPIVLAGMPERIAEAQQEPSPSPQSAVHSAGNSSAPTSFGMVSLSGSL